MLRMVAFTSILAAASGSLAAPQKSPGAHVDEWQSHAQTCMDRSDGTNGAWNRCARDEVDRQELALGEVWKRVYGLTEGKTKTDLLSEQRTWLSYESKSCQMYMNGEWGREGEVLRWGLCRADVIATRIKQLQDIERDLSPYIPK